jgi:hypothetical protein
MASFGAAENGFVWREKYWLRLARSKMASFGAVASFGAWYSSPATGHRPPANGFGTIRIVKEPAGREVPLSSSAPHARTASDFQDHRQDH